MAKKVTKKQSGAETSATPTAPAAAKMSYITPGLHPLAVPVGTLRPDPRNARLHGEKNQKAIRRSLEQFGQQRPIIADAEGIILAGNGTYQQAIQLGWEFIAAVKSHLSGSAARAYALADNRSGELAEWDAEELEAQIGELEAEGFEEIDLGFNEGELDAMLEGEFETAHGFTPAKPKREPPPAPTEFEPQFKLIVTCANEAEQADLIEKFEKMGLKYTAPSM